jgi:hypothetical protein
MSIMIFDENVVGRKMRANCACIQLYTRRRTTFVSLLCDSRGVSVRLVTEGERAVDVGVLRVRLHREIEVARQ